MVLLADTLTSNVYEKLKTGIFNFKKYESHLDGQFSKISLTLTI
jgi:hypothetical protein